MINSGMNMQTPNMYQGQALPDDTDRVSSIVGFDVNNYVFGGGNPAPQAQPMQNPVNNQNVNYIPNGSNVFQNTKQDNKKGLLLLIILGGTAALLLRNKIKLPQAGSFTTSVSNAFNTVKSKVSGLIGRLRHTQTP